MPIQHEGRLEVNRRPRTTHSLSIGRAQDTTSCAAPATSNPHNPLTKPADRRPDRERRSEPSIYCLVCAARDDVALRCRQMRGGHFCVLRRTRHAA
jgi:hypothetical protein